MSRLRSLLATRDVWIALGAVLGIALHLVLRHATDVPRGPLADELPLYIVLIAGGAPLMLDLARSVLRLQFGADLLAGLSIAVSLILGEPLAGAIVVLMLSGGEALEDAAVGRASSVLDALARRSPTVAHRIVGDELTDVPVADVEVGDLLRIFPHEICPVDGVVVDGRGRMDESYLTGEPYEIRKAPGSRAISGAINGEDALTVRAEARAVDSRYARIMSVVRDADANRPPIRRLADRLGALYTPLAVAVAAVAWAASGDPTRFLAVLVVATPCPLLIAVPVALVGAVSLAARSGIIVRDPAILERIDRCTTLILDKTGTLTVGRPVVVGVDALSDVSPDDVLRLAASAEVYSRHPLASALREAAAAEGLGLRPVDELGERPGEGLRARIDGREVRLIGRGHLEPEARQRLPAVEPGLETLVLIDGELAARIRFRDEPRADGRSFIAHLAPNHELDRVWIVSGDRDAEVQALAKRVGVHRVVSEASPEDKVAIVERERAHGPVLFVGDGVNDAPALRAADVGVALGRAHEITAEAAGAVVLEPSLSRLDALLHIGQRMRRIALQSALGGMALSLIGMGFAAAGMLPPVAGAIAQEVIDLVAVLNALRVGLSRTSLNDYGTLEGSPADRFLRRTGTTAGAHPGRQGAPPRDRSPDEGDERQLPR